jgi:hypothetical protein
MSSVEEIIGINDLNVVLNHANIINSYSLNDNEQLISFDEVSSLLVALEQLYGSNGGQGLALRIGRVFQGLKGVLG